MPNNGFSNQTLKPIRFIFEVIPSPALFHVLLVPYLAFHAHFYDIHKASNTKSWHKIFNGGINTTCKFHGIVELS
jgi:hypothetical protein